jgi:hypothetical protein
MKQFLAAKLFGLVTAPIVLFAPSAIACDCAGSDPFVKTAARSDLVVRGKILEYQPEQSATNPTFPLAMVVEVTEVLKGKSQPKRLTVLGDNGMICRSYVSRFPIGTEWVLAVSPDQWSKKSELAISACGEYALPVADNAVKGRITLKAKDAESMTLTNLRRLLKVKPKVAQVDGAKGQCVDRVTKASV